jgi:hypothetical protein
MGKKPASRAEFVRFDVFYKDGSQRSNRKVPKPALAGIDDHDAVALAILEEQAIPIARHPTNFMRSFASFQRPTASRV